MDRFFIDKMYLTGDSVLYTSTGWRAISDIRSHEILLVACCDIIGRLSFSLTQLIINHDIISSNQFYRRTLPNGFNNLIANGKYNSREGWINPSSSEEVRVFDVIPTTIIITRVDISPSVQPASLFTNICDIVGLPIGVIIDGVSVYPVNVMNNVVSDMSGDKNYFFRRKYIPFQLASEELKQLESKMIIETQSVAYVQSIQQGVDMLPNTSYNPLLD